MKLLKYFAIVAAAVFALTVTAKADLTFLGAVAFTGGPGGNSPAQDLVALGTFDSIDTTGFVLCGNFENLANVDQSIDVFAGAFLVVHYGKGPTGTNPGGSLEFFEVINGETHVTVPGTPNPLDTFAGGAPTISSIREFCPPGTHVPDSGTTAMLLGSALAGFGLMRRYLKR